MNVLLTGSGGFVGRNVGAALQLAGHHVQAASRRQGLDYAYMGSAAAWRPWLVGVDAVINCVGIICEGGKQRFASLHTEAPLALFQACRDFGVPRVIQISALGADQSAFSAYHLSKRAADDGLRAMELESFVLRPSLIYGKGGASAAFFMGLARWPWIPVIGGGQQFLQPVHIRDVVDTVLACLKAPAQRLTLDVLGSETFSFADWMQWNRQAQGLARGPLLSLPVGLARGLAHWLKLIHPLLQPENLDMLQRGCRGDHRALAEFLGRPPLTVQPELFFLDGLPAGSLP